MQLEFPTGIPSQTSLGISTEISPENPSVFQGLNLEF